ncbi:hypothetical protein ES707_21200 [subsurface metagenome]
MLVSPARGHLARAGVIDIGVDKRLISIDSGAFPSLLSRKSGKKKLEEVIGRMFCPRERCPHYGKATKYSQKCYYEPQCWKGWLDLMLKTMWLATIGRFTRRRL